MVASQQVRGNVRSLARKLEMGSRWKWAWKVVQVNTGKAPSSGWPEAFPLSLRFPICKASYRIHWMLMVLLLAPAVTAWNKGPTLS